MSEIVAMVESLPFQAKASMLEDLERGKRLELPWLSGGVVRLGEAVGVHDADPPFHRNRAETAREWQHPIVG